MGNVAAGGLGQMWWRNTGEPVETHALIKSRRNQVSDPLVLPMLWGRDIRI